MNTELTEENYQALSRYRQERAHETYKLTDAKVPTFHKTTK